MTLKDILESVLVDRGPIILFFIISMSIVQIAPIKINPWSAIFRWFGKQLNTEVIEKVDVIEERLDRHISESEENTLKARRARILDFASNIIKDMNYHKEKFDFIINECDSYQMYCNENNIADGVVDASIAEIRRIYQEHLRNNDFLSEKNLDTNSNPMDRME